MWYHPICTFRALLKYPITSIRPREKMQLVDDKNIQKHYSKAIDG